MPFGLRNTGSICYLNSFLQALLGCTAWLRAVRDSAGETRTGRAVREFVLAAMAPDADADIAGHSAKILAALTEDLRERRPAVAFGLGQESASEVFIHLLEMMEPPVMVAEASAATKESLAPPPKPGPIRRLFERRFRCEIFCRACRTTVSTTNDDSVLTTLFHVTATDHDEFCRQFCQQITTCTDFVCERCQTKGTALRAYTLVRLPEIVFATFDCYGRRPDHRWFPKQLRLPGAAPVAGARPQHCYRLCGQIIHSGGLDGGHYWAFSLRQREGMVEPYVLNDTGVSRAADFTQHGGCYVVVYHYESTV